MSMVLYALAMDTNARSVEAQPGDSPVAVPGQLGPWFAAAAGLGLISSILFRALPLDSFHWGLRLAVALLPAPALIGVVLAARRIARHMDELERRIQLEALAMAFGVAGIAFLLFSQLQIAGMLGPEDWFIPWLAIWGGYVLGLAGARRRYQ